MITKEVNLFVFDTKENFEKSKDFLGKEGALFKTIKQISSLDELKVAISRLDSKEKLSLVVHVFYTDKISGIRKFKASGILDEYPSLEVMYISDGDERDIKHQMLDAGLAPAEVYKYHDVYSNLNEGVIKAITKEQLSDLHANTQNTKESKFEFGIITALYQDEFEEVKKHFVWLDDQSITVGMKKYWVGHLIGHPERKVIAAIPHATGMVDSAIIATQMLDLFKPKYLLMSGVCGGKKDTNFGDIVLAKRVFTFQKGKVSDIIDNNKKPIELYDKNQQKVDYDKLFDKDGNQIAISVEKFEIEHDSILEFQLKDWTDPELKRIEKAINESEVIEHKGTPITIHFEPMACSTMVINRNGFFEDHIKSVDRHTVAVEMESYGVARACLFGNEGRSKWVIFKSVMDNTTQKDDKAKKFAAYTSAQFLKHLIYDNILK